MKKGILSVIALCTLLVSGCCLEEGPDNIIVTADVLSVNEQILEGRMIGAFLGSASGNFSNDVIKVGVSFQYNGHLRLYDLKLNHAELAYYKDRTTLDLNIRIPHTVGSGKNVYLNNRLVLTFHN